jgi:hypothetical protein
MSWAVIASLMLLGVAILAILAGAIYTSVSKYARRLDPMERQRDPLNRR